MAAGTHPVLMQMCLYLWISRLWGPGALGSLGGLRSPGDSWGDGRGCFQLQTVSQEGEGLIWKSREAKALREGVSQGPEAAGLERRTEKRKLMQLKLQADLDSNCRVAKRHWYANHFKPVSSSVKWGQGQVMLDVTYLITMYPCPCHRGVCV